MEASTLHEPETQAILDWVAHRTPVDPDLARRIRERGEEIRREVAKRHGVLDIGVPAIRELRGPLPE